MCCCHWLFLLFMLFARKFDIVCGINFMIGRWYYPSSMALCVRHLCQKLFLRNNNNKKKRKQQLKRSEWKIKKNLFTLSFYHLSCACVRVCVFIEKLRAKLPYKWMTKANVFGYIMASDTVLTFHLLLKFPLRNRERLTEALNRQIMYINMWIEHCASQSSSSISKKQTNDNLFLHSLFI